MLIFAIEFKLLSTIMDVLARESLPVEVRKYLVQKRMEALKMYQGSMTCEKYGVYMKN